MVSPMHWSMPYFLGMSLSKRTQASAADFNAADDVVGAGQDLGAVGRGFDLPVFLPICRAWFWMTWCIVSRRSVSMSTRAMIPPCSPGIRRMSLTRVGVKPLPAPSMVTLMGRRISPLRPRPRRPWCGPRGPPHSVDFSVSSITSSVTAVGMVCLLQDCRLNVQGAWRLGRASHLGGAWHAMPLPGRLFGLSQQAVFQAVHNGVPGGVNDVGGDADGTPTVLGVGAVHDGADFGRRAFLAADDADFEVGQADGASSG